LLCWTFAGRKKQTATSDPQAAGAGKYAETTNEPSTVDVEMAVQEGETGTGDY